MDPIPISDISGAIKDIYGTRGSICPEAQKVIEQGTQFDRRETKSALQLVTFHDEAGRMIYESYVPNGFSDAQAVEFAARLIANHNPLKDKVKKSSVKRK